MLVGSLLMGISACSVNKKTGKAPATAKFWHNMNSRYNGYYNARMRVDKAFDQLDEAHKDNYNQVLALYKHAAIENSSAANGILDEAIKKCAMVIELHKPISKWSDDALLLVGMAEYLKKDYTKAQATFRYISLEYNPDKPKFRMSKYERIQKKKEEIWEKEKKKKETTKDKEDAKKAKEKEKAKVKKNKEKERRDKLKAKKKAARMKKKGKHYNANMNKGQEYKPKKEENWEKPLPPPPPPAKIDSTKLKKKEEAEKKKKKKNYFMRHRPCYLDAVMWEARAQVELNNFAEAEGLLLRLEGEPNFPEKYYPDLHVIRSHSAVKQKQFDKAISELEIALKLNKSKKKRTRYTYILAQLYQMKDERKKAAQLFNQVVAWSPDYEMDFNARLGGALNGSGSGADNPRAMLKRMLGETKNEEYQDQIYYTLGKMEQESGQEYLAQELWKKSLTRNKSNQPLKAETYLALADTYLKQEDYIRSVKYYDSTMVALDKKDERYPRVKSMVDGLGDVAAQLEIIETQDSLLIVADWDYAKKKDLAKKLKKKRLNDIMASAKPAPGAGGTSFKDRTDPTAMMSSDVANKEIGPGGSKSATQPARPAPQPESNSPTVAMMKSEFPIYNPELKKKGQREFQRKFGTRPLVDNWRRIGGTSSGSDAKTDAGQEGDVLGSATITEPEVEALLADNGVPLTPEAKEKSKNSIADAMFKVGKIYRDKLNDRKKAKAMLEKFMNRYPTSPNVEEAMLYLYLIALEEGNTTQAESWKAQILAKFPNGKIAASLNDPDYLKRMKQKGQSVEDFYNQMYVLVEDKRDYITADSLIATAAATYGKDHKFVSKLALLKAKCIGGTKGKEAYVDALKTLKTTYPGTPEEKKAEEMLKFLNAGSGAATNAPSSATAFKYNAADQHFLMVVPASKTAEVNQIQLVISDYNAQFHNIEGLKVNNNYLDPQNALVFVKKFDNADVAKRYLEEVEAKQQQFTGVPCRLLIISQENYRLLLSNKDMNGYDSFYASKYK